MFGPGQIATALLSLGFKMSFFKKNSAREPRFGGENNILYEFLLL
jgi:hypothetical protein